MKVLVTGSTGYLAGHVILQLLGRGIEVIGTVRSLARVNQVRNSLENAGASDCQNLSFVEADLTNDGGWSTAMKGCEYVIHIASPFPGVAVKDESDLITPAVNGTQRVLRAAKDSHVRRVVVTSSFGAVGYGHPPSKTDFDETDWTNENEPGISAYIKSKTLAERAVWSFENDEAADMEIVVVNPTGIFGPTLSKNISSSLNLIRLQLEGKMPICPKVYFGVSDVRDVADLHIRAMLNPVAAGKRYLAVSGESVSMFDVAKVLRAEFGARAVKVPRRESPDWLVKFLGRWSQSIRPISSELGKRKNASNLRAVTELDWAPRDYKVTIVDTAESLFHHGVIESPS